MTGGLGDIDQCLEGRTFLANQIAEWNKIISEVDDPTGFAQSQVYHLSMVDNLLKGKIETLEKFGVTPPPQGQ